VSLRDLHDAHAFPVALGMSHAEVASGALVDVPALLLPDDRDRLSSEAC
jgi:hypothetical protein